MEFKLYSRINNIWYMMCLYWYDDINLCFVYGKSRLSVVLVQTYYKETKRRQSELSWRINVLILYRACLLLWDHFKMDYKIFMAESDHRSLLHMSAISPIVLTRTISGQEWKFNRRGGVKVGIKKGIRDWDWKGLD